MSRLRGAMFQAEEPSGSSKDAEIEALKSRVGELEVEILFNEKDAANALKQNKEQDEIIGKLFKQIKEADEFNKSLLKQIKEEDESNKSFFKQIKEADECKKSLLKQIKEKDEKIAEMKSQQYIHSEVAHLCNEVDELGSIRRQRDDDLHLFCTRGQNYAIKRMRRIERFLHMPEPTPDELESPGTPE